MRRVVITGIGAVSPHGMGTPAFWNALLEQKSGTTKLTRFDPSAFSSQVAGVVPPFKPQEYVPKSYRKATKIMARDIEIAVAAADFAARDGKLLTKGVAEGIPEEKLAALRADGWSHPDPTRMGCNIGAGLISADLDELTRATVEVRDPDNTMSLIRWGRSDDPTKTSGMENLTPLWLLKYLPNMLASHISIIHNTQGPSNAITCAQASAGLALSEATRTIQRGAADVALVGGCESKVHPMALMRWSLLNRLNGDSNDNPGNACRPYDTTANGAIIAEGGAIFVIEEYEHAKRRGATIYAELAGFGASAAPGQSVVEPDTTGEACAVAMKKAMKDAAIAPDSVSLLVPPGYSIKTWDQADSNAFHTAFGSALANLAILPARAGIGDCGAGAQALDIAAAALAIHHQTIPAATNFAHPIDNLPLSRQKITKPFTHALILAAGLGGQNSAVILKKVT